MKDYSGCDSDRLGIAPPRNRKTISTCLRRGWWSINLPVFVLIAAGYCAPILIMKLTGTGNADTPLPKPDSNSLLGLMMFVPVFIFIVVIPVLPAWLWWSYATPKWRLWALRNVDNWPKLEKAAIKEKLIWPRTSIFNLTEIKSSAQKTLERELIAYRHRYG